MTNNHMKTCIIVDIDGTLANNTRRSPYDLTQCGEDPLILPTKLIVDRAYEHVAVFLVSGRSEEYRPQTEARLHKHGIAFTKLFMRPKDDTRPDTEIKKEIYHNNIEPTHRPLFAIDDRNRIVDQRREM